MLITTLWIGLIILSLSTGLCFYRVIVGPDQTDRIIALDAISIHMIAMIGMVMILQKTVAYAEVILVIGVIGLIGSLALAKFIERGVVIDRNHR